jgi:GR25 family glycosyltransferase involved in LPS biosynthesis
MEKYVDKVYLINMDQDTKKLKEVTKECNKFNIKFERFSGVNPLKLSEEELEKYVTKNCQNMCSNGLIGCGISHMKIYEKALENNYKNILILEDDVYFTIDLYKVLDNAMKELPDDYDILYLGCSGLCEKTKSYDMDYSLVFNLFNVNKKVIDKNYIHIPKFPLSTHAMIISNKGCRKLLNVIGKIYGHIDFTIASKNNELEIYATNKILAKQKWDYSHNSDMSSNYLLNNYFKDIKYNNGIPYSYLFNLYIIKVNNTYITYLDIIFFLLGIFSYINKYLFIFLLVLLIINQKQSIIISYLIGYLVVFIIFNSNNLYKIKL